MDAKSSEEEALEGIPLEPPPEPAEGGEATPFVYDENQPNLAFDFEKHPKGKRALEALAARVIREHDADWDATEEYRERRAADWKVFAGEMKKKSFPFENCANAHVPILIENATRLTSRIESEFGDFAECSAFVPIGPSGQEEADLLTLHSRWQFSEKIVDWRRQWRRALSLYIVGGDLTCYSYYDPTRRRNCHEMLTPDEFVVPYTYCTTDPDYGDVPRYSKICRYFRHEIQQYIGTWVGVEKLLSDFKPEWEDQDAPVREAGAEIAGEDTPTEVSSGAPFVIIQYEGYLPLPNQKKDRFCRVFVSKQSKKVLSLSIHEEADPLDLERFNEQAAAMEQYAQMMGQYQAMAAEHAQNTAMAQAAAAQGIPTEPLPELPPPPPPPPFLKDPADIGFQPDSPRKTPIRQFTHAVCMEPLVGSLGISYGRILGDYNRGADTVFSQFIDSATLGNAWGLITANTVDFDRPFKWGPGTINKATGVSGAELKDAILPMKPDPANPQLLQAMDLMRSFAQAAAQSQEVLSGAPGKSGETFRGIATRIEQAKTPITVAARAFGEFFRNVAQKNAYLNSVFLDDEELFYIDRHAGFQEQAKVSRTMYRRNYRIKLVPDLKFESEQERVASADQVLGMVGTLPPLQSNLPFIYEAIKKCLLARGRRDMVTMLGPPPSPPTTPLGIPPPPPPGMLPPGPPPPGQGTPPKAPSPPGIPGPKPGPDTGQPEPPARGAPHPPTPQQQPAPQPSPTQ